MNRLTIRLEALLMASKETYRDWRIMWMDRNLAYSAYSFGEFYSGVPGTIHVSSKQDVKKVAKLVKHLAKRSYKDGIHRDKVTLKYKDATVWWIGDAKDVAQANISLHSWYLHNHDAVVAYWNAEIDEDQLMDRLVKPS